jgi:F0F1-type ATP synthase epsilon subunit
MKEHETFTVIVMSPSGVIWEGQVMSLSSKNSEGEFDIYPDHARFMTLLEKVPVVLFLPSGEQKSITCSEAVLFFEDAKATIYVHSEAR